MMLHPTVATACHARKPARGLVLPHLLIALVLLAPVSAYSFSLPQLLQMPFEELLRLDITAPGGRP
jgi:hypothetical protein